MKPKQPTLSTIKAWAYQAGDILRAGYGNRHTIEHKGEIDLVTEMDKKTETFLVENIQTHFPEHTIITEESGLLNGSRSDACWYLDPLDGTTNYAHNLPFFSVSIAYAENDEILAGVVYDPVRQECFSAERGKGAWLNDQPIHVSDTTELINSLLVTGFPYNMNREGPNNLANFNRLSRMTQSVRRLGSAALDFCYVAAGRVDGYWEIILQPWDMAAGALIAQEAGAMITDFEGQPDFFKKPYASITATPALHAKLLAELHAADN